MPPDALRAAGPAYTHPAARRVAEHALRLLAATGADDEDTAADVDLVAAAIDVAFWGSLRREEGASPRVTLAFTGPAAGGEPLAFARPLRLRAATLARLAPAVERPGIHLGAERSARSGGGVRLWGLTRHLRPYTLVLEVVAPGLLVLKYPPADGGKFVNLAVIEGDEVRIVDQGGGPVASARVPNARTDGPTPLTRQFGLDEPAHRWDAVAELLVEIAVGMRAHGRGGTLLVVPGGAGDWRASLVRSNPYRVGTAAGTGDGTVAPDARRPGSTLAADAAAIAGLTAVDGATVLDDACRVLAFGAKIVRRRGSPQVRVALLSEPVAGDVPRLVPLARLGGTRHLSAAQFVTDQRDALALVASQDGRFTVFRWLGASHGVGAHRVDLLLV